MSLGRGDVVGLVGLSGAGKSTLGRLCKGMLEAVSGRFYTTATASDGKRVTATLNAAARRPLVGWVEARSEIQLFAESAREELAFGLRNQGVAGGELERRIQWALASVGLESGAFLGRHPRTLSGGEKRRLALASVAAMDFPYYIFDEPTAALDPDGVTAFRDLVSALKERGAGILWMTHDLGGLPGAVDRLALLDRGRLRLELPAVAVDWERVARNLSDGRMYVY